MAKRIYNSTPKQDGFRMPGEFEPHDHVFMIWPERCDNWRQGAKPAQRAYTEVAKAIAKHTPVTMLVNNTQYANARARLPENIRVVELSSDDAWVRDCGPTFVINDKGDIRYQVTAASTGSSMRGAVLWTVFTSRGRTTMRWRRRSAT